MHIRYLFLLYLMQISIYSFILFTTGHLKQVDALDEKRIQRYNWWTTKAEKTQPTNWFPDDKKVKYNTKQ
jgi:hypothetical protein